jgi:predicted porin
MMQRGLLSTFALATLCLTAPSAMAEERVLAPTSTPATPEEIGAAQIGIEIGEERPASSDFYTPRLEGFQLGFKYSPEKSDDSAGAPVGAKKDDKAAMGVALSFDRAFGDLNVGASASYVKSGEKDAETGQKPEKVGVGLRLGLGGFSVSGAYEGAKETPDESKESYGAGMAYKTGLFSATLSYKYGEDERAGIETDEVELGARYKLAPGLDAKGALQYSDKESAAGEKQDGVAVVGGIALSF